MGSSPPPKTPPEDRLRGAASAAVVVACLVVALLCLAHIDQMFLDGHLGYAGSLRGVIGANYLRFDPIETRFAPLQNGGPTHDARPSVRFNHPPLAGMLVGLVFAISGGPSEVAARLVPLVASVLTVPLLFGFLIRTWGEWIALIGLALWCCSPFVAIYGSMVSYEPLVLFAWMLLVRTWSVWRGQGANRTTLTVTVASIFIGVWTDWPMVALVSGLIGVELILVIRRRPRRPAFLMTLVTALISALGLLALYYFVILDIDRGGLESLYSARSSIGRWALEDVVVHIASRTSLLLTWPLLVAAVFGFVVLVVGRPTWPAPLAKEGRLVFAVGLLCPAMGLLVLLPQHAVIHCFSAWYLLPAMVVAGATAVLLVCRAVARRLGAAASGLLAIIFIGAVVWTAIPVIADGWISDGSPFEGRPRLEYRHLVLARWAAEHTSETDELLIDPSTKVIGVRSWFQHRRSVQRLELPHGALLRAETLAEAHAELALISRGRIDESAFRVISERWRTTLVDESLVVDMRRGGESSPPRVLELTESSPTPLWNFFHSPCYPPHRFTEARARSTVYQLQRGSTAPRLMERFETRTKQKRSLAELAAVHILARTDTDRREVEKALRARLSVTMDEQMCDDLEWLGASIEPSPNGSLTLRMVLRTAQATSRMPRLQGALEREGEERRLADRWRIIPDDVFERPAGSFIIASHRLSSTFPVGGYRLGVSGCGRAFQSPAVVMEPHPLLSVLRPVGRI